MVKRNIKWLSGCYFGYFGVLGVMVPYLSVFLAGRGFNSVEIGSLMSAALAMRIVGPNFWAWIVEKTGHRLVVIRIGVLLGMVLLLSLGTHRYYGLMLVTLAAYNLCWNGVLPQVETFTLNNLGNLASRYAKVRVWGSIGFIVVTMLTGFLVAHLGSETVIWTAGLAAFLMLSCSMPLKPNRHSALKVATTSLQSLRWTQLFRPPMLLFWAAILCLQISYGPYYTFFVLYLKQGGYSAPLASALVSLGVIAEIVMFLLASRLFRRFGAYRILLVSMGLAALRWLLLGYCRDQIWLLTFSQTLHAASFALVHLAAMQLLTRQFPNQLLGSAQAFYAACGFGLGGALGALFAGWSWHDGSGALWSLQWAALVALLGMVLVALMPAAMFTRQEQVDA